ncbi:MAG: hydrolase TatD, partial [Fusobacterium mortiferum]
MKLIDSHAHLDNEQFDEDRAEVLERIKENLEFTVNIGYDIESSRRSVKYANEND